MQYTLSGKYLEAIQSGREALKLLGIDLQEQNLKTAFEYEITEFRKNLEGRSISSLLNNFEMKIPEKKAALKLLTRLVAPAWASNPQLMYVIVVKSVNLSVKYGHTTKSPMSYSFFETIHSHVLHDYRTGYELGTLGLKLSDKFNDLSSKILATQMHANMGMPWLMHIKYSETINNEGYDAGLQSGDLQYMGYSLTYNLFNLIYQGKNLDYLLKETSKFLLFSQESKNQWAIDCILGCEILLSNLLGLTKEKLCFDNAEISEPLYLAQNEEKKTPAATCFYYILKSKIIYLYNKFAEALTCVKQAEKLVNFIPGTISIAQLNFYHSLTLSALYPKASIQEQEEYDKKLKANQKQMKVWADNCPENFLHKYLLVAAEIARISGRWQEAIDLYDQAIESAREHEFIQDEALANELAAKFWLAKGKEEFAQVYLKKAHQGYQIWGAKRKVEDLDEQYPQLLASTSSGIKNTSINSVTISSRSAVESLDLATVLKASQTISGEIILDKLLKNLMKIVIENAGAQKGFLILDKEGSWVIEGEGTIDSDEVTLLQSIPVDSVDPDSQIPFLSAAIINYVTRTQENVVLNDAVHEGQFTRDAYIVATQPKSILCTPLLNQGKLSGILYLENNLTTSAFTSDRVEILKILSAQAAISIENSRLYEQLEDSNRTLEHKVEARTEELQQKNQDLATLLQKLKATQAQIIAQEKLASLGALTAGIAHEIKNPLNFVNNFAEVSVELTQELLEEIESQKDRFDSQTRENIAEILDTLSQNCQKINEHGKRADNIVRGMLMHSRGKTGERQLTNINTLLTEAVNLACNAMRAKAPSFNITIKPEYERDLRQINVIPQNLSRVFINIINNACYAAHQKKLHLLKSENEDVPLEPTLSVSTKDLGSQLEIRIRDNGEGMTQEVVDKIFEPFFTTKPPGEGTGLGLSICHDIIVQQHQGAISVETENGSFAEFIITLPEI
ncbi:MAG: ATP-binding protein [Rhizonema sp. NSF051]|nr:ATP-binding protein [Rhizonema sp. NSF051]